MNIEKIVTDLISFKTSHNNPKEIKSCLKYCKDLFKNEEKENKIFIKEYSKNNIDSLVISNTNDKDLDVILLGHIDTVDGPDELFEAKIKNGFLYGRGSMDMKAFVGTNLVVLKEIITKKIPLKIAVFVVSDEELGGEFGAKFLVNEIGYTASKTVLVPDDGEKITQIVSKSKSIMSLKFKAIGKEAHGCMPWDGENAIEKNIKVYNNLKKYFSIPDGITGEQWINTINLGIMNGGTASNEVPGESEMQINIRWVDMVSKKEIIDLIEKSLVDGVSYEIIMDAQGTVLDLENEYTKEYISSIKEITKKDVAFLKSGGGTDGRYFYYNGMNVITHQGTGGDFQGENENVEIKSLYDLVNIQLNFLKKISKK